MATDDSDSFIRWQSTTREHFSSTSNLVLGLATGLLAFHSSLLFEQKISHPQAFAFGIASIILLSFSVGLALGCTINRLRDFRLTTQIARKREKGETDLSALRQKTGSLGKNTWRLFWGQIWLFGLGALTGAISVVIQAFQ